MLVKGLGRDPAGERPKSTRKHEGVRTSTARNAIVKDPDNGAYVANTDGGELADALNGINLRLNALELNQSRLMREATSDAAAPKLSGNVVPMSVAREAKEQSKAIPVSQPGNEAEVQVLPAPEPDVIEVVETPLKSGNTEPAIIGKVVNISSVAANELLPEETEGLLERLAEVYGMDLVDASRILHKEAQKRDRACIKEHGMPLKEVRCDRYIAQKGIVETNPALQVWIKAENSGFKAWSRGLFQRECELVAERKPAAPRAWGKLTKGEQAYRKKLVIQRAAARPKGSKPGLIRINEVARKLYVDGPGVTTHSQVQAIRTWGWDIYQRSRKLLGMQPTVRGANLRTRYEVGATLNSEGPPPNAHRQATAPVDLIKEGEELTQAELVRRCQRTGIGY